MPGDEDKRMILDALREVKEDNRQANSVYRETREALVKVTTQQEANQVEIERARANIKALEHRITVIESQAQGAEKTGSSVVQYVGVLLAIAAGVMSLVGLLK